MDLYHPGIAYAPYTDYRKTSPDIGLFTFDEPIFLR